ncbi:MAG: hypothetical protein IBJ12_02705 [Sphingomonadaceae bacterium]|nr:hypothetical protein [Sphingomonadaceae bacterium]
MPINDPAIEEIMLMPAFMRPRPPVKPTEIALGATAVVAVVSVAWVLSSLSLSATSPLGIVALSSLSFLSGGSLSEIAGSASTTFGAAGSIALVSAGALIAVACVAVIGQFLTGPLLRTYGPRMGPPKLGPDGQLPRWMRIMMWILPPPPMPKPGDPPLTRKYGIPIAALVHALPPPGPWWIRIVVDLILGGSMMRWLSLLIGSYLGFVIQLGALAAMDNSGFEAPAPPSGWMLIPAILAPLIIVPLVRLIFIGARRLFAGSKPEAS